MIKKISWTTWIKGNERFNKTNERKEWMREIENENRSENVNDKIWYDLKRIKIKW